MAIPLTCQSTLTTASLNTRDDGASTSVVSTYSAVLEHRCNDALKVRNATLFDDDQFDRSSAS